MRTVSQLMNLAGRRALVTGGAGHIGAAVAETFSELGATTAILDRDADASRRCEAALNQHRSGSVFAVTCDLSNENDTRLAARDTIRRLGGLDVLVHCAAWVGTTQAAGWIAPFTSQTVDSWNAAMGVNLTAAFVLAQEAQEALAQSGNGSIILFSSIYGLVGPDMRLYEGTGMGNAAGYGASKAGLLQLTRHLACVLAPRIRVNAISPGGVWRGQPEAFRTRYEARTPVGRMASEEDLKGAVAYLASDMSAYVTGHNLVVDGGWTSW